MSRRLNDYFAEEAADYLRQMAGLLASPVAADPLRVLRLATGVRGSTQMAGANEVADLAGRLEAWARDILDGKLDWADESRELARRTVQEMQTLVQHLDEWTDREAERTRAVAGSWDEPGASPAAYAGSADVVPIEALFYDDEGPHIIEPSTLAGERATIPTVPIERLLYRGHGALEAALALRTSIDEALGASSDPARLSDLLDEVFDLIDLGLTEESPEV